MRVTRCLGRLRATFYSPCLARGHRSAFALREDSVKTFGETLVPQYDRANRPSEPPMAFSQGHSLLVRTSAAASEAISNPAPSEICTGVWLRKSQARPHTSPSLSRSCLMRALRARGTAYTRTFQC